jgi:hypothetical protein
MLCVCVLCVTVYIYAQAARAFFFMRWEEKQRNGKGVRSCEKEMGGLGWWLIEHSTKGSTI